MKRGYLGARRFIKGLLLWMAVIAGVFLLQSLLSAGSLRLNLTLLPVYYLGLRRGEVPGVAAGLPVGFLEDALSGQIIGPGMLGKGMIGVLSTYVSGSFFIWTPLLGILSIFALTVVDETVIYTSLSLFSQPPVPLRDFVVTVLIKALVNAPFGGLIRPEQ